MFAAGAHLVARGGRRAAALLDHILLQALRNHSSGEGTPGRAGRGGTPQGCRGNQVAGSRGVGDHPSSGAIESAEHRATHHDCEGRAGLWGWECRWIDDSTDAGGDGGSLCTGAKESSTARRSTKLLETSGYLAFGCTLQQPIHPWNRDGGAWQAGGTPGAAGGAELHGARCGAPASMLYSLMLKTSVDIAHSLQNASNPNGFFARGIAASAGLNLPSQRCTSPLSTMFRPHRAPAACGRRRTAPPAAQAGHQGGAAQRAAGPPAGIPAHPRGRQRQSAAAAGRGGWRTSGHGAWQVGAAALAKGAGDEGPRCPAAWWFHKPGRRTAARQPLTISAVGARRSAASQDGGRTRAVSQACMPLPTRWGLPIPGLLMPPNPPTPHHHPTPLTPSHLAAATMSGRGPMWKWTWPAACLT